MFNAPSGRKEYRHRESGYIVQATKLPNGYRVHDYHTYPGGNSLVDIPLATSDFTKLFEPIEEERKCEICGAYTKEPNTMCKACCDICHDLCRLRTANNARDALKALVARARENAPAMP